MSKPRDGRIFEPVVTATVDNVDGVLELRSPMVGLWRRGPRAGELVGPGEDLGEIEVLGRIHRLVAPDGAGGAVIEDPQRANVQPVAVEYGALLLRLDPAASPQATLAATADAAAASGLVFRAPLSGRFYGRPTPDKPPFVRPGDVVKTGQTIALLEVMKTFNRVVFGGPDMPSQAKVKRVVPADEADLDEGDPILELESNG